MTDLMRKYTDYRASGDDWLGEIPAHWRSTSLGAISTRKSLRNRPDLPLLSVLREKGVVLRSSLSQDENHNFIPDDLSNYQVASEGDLVVNKMKAWQGSVGIAPQDGIVSPAYYIFGLAEIKKKYAHRLLRSRLYADFFGRASDGVRIGQWDLGISAMKRIPVVIPPPEEQDSIARYLDEMDRRITRFIRNRRRLIEVLNEQKQAIINQAVTRGLDPSAPLKPSGIDWLGNIPEHWNLAKVRTLFEVCGSGTTPSGDQYYAGPVPWLMTGDLNDSIIAETRRRVTKKALEDHSALKMYPAGALVIALYGATIGKTGITTFECCTNQACSVLAQPKKGVDATFVQRIFVTAKPYLLGLSYGGGQPNISSAIVRSLRVPLPPLNEQRAMLAHISSECESLDSAASRARCEIDLIREYRTRLIADVVTGKVDVRPVCVQRTGRHLATPPDSEDLEETIDELEPLDDAAGELDEDTLAGEATHAD